MLILHVGYFHLEGISSLEKALFLVGRLGSKESNMYLALFTLAGNMVLYISTYFIGSIPIKIKKMDDGEKSG